MSLYEYKTNIRYGVINTKNNGRISGWDEKPEIKGQKSTWVAMLWSLTYLILFLKISHMEWMMSSKKPFPNEKMINSILTKKRFIDIGDKETYEKTNLEYRKKL